VLVLAACLVLAGTACARRPVCPNLVLIVVDALRADHLGAYGYGRPTSPNIDRLAREGVVFDSAVATSSWTRPSVGSLFTSRLPSEHAADSYTTGLSPDLPTLAESLREAAYHTVGVSGNFIHVNEGGFERGFERWRPLGKRVDRGGEDVLWSVRRENEKPVELRAPRAQEVNDEVFEALGDSPAQPMFLYVHYMDPHTGYMPPAALRSRFERDPRAHARGRAATSEYIIDLAAGRERASETERRRLVDLYDAEIAAVDEAIGALVAALAARGLWEETVLVLTSDHGEAFDEHDTWFHGLNLHAELLHVPLILVDTRSETRGTRRQEVVSLLDVPTTLLRLAGLPPAPGMQGGDLLAARRAAARTVEAELPRFEELEKSRRIVHAGSVIRWPWKLIARRDGLPPLVFRLDEDPDELRALDPGADVPPDLVEAAARLGRRVAARDAVRADAPLDARTRAALRSLGYLE
jgi:arylsulfatase